MLIRFIQSQQIIFYKNNLKVKIEVNCILLYNRKKTFNFNTFCPKIFLKTKNLVNGNNHSVSNNKPVSYIEDCNFVHLCIVS